jgi:uncharacterized protein DUF4892
VTSGFISVMRNTAGLLCALWAANSWSDVVGTPLELVAFLDSIPHVVDISRSQQQVRDHEVGLGAIRKTRGAWQFKDSERLTGELSRHTWQVVDGFSSLEILERVVAQLDSMEGGAMLFACEGRSCGPGVQWANRVFGQRVLYGREELQRYKVYSIASQPAYRVLLFSSARTADRQYFHLEVLEVAP